MPLVSVTSNFKFGPNLDGETHLSYAALEAPEESVDTGMYAARQFPRYEPEDDHFARPHEREREPDHHHHRPHARVTDHHHRPHERETAARPHIEPKDRWLSNQPPDATKFTKPHERETEPIKSRTGGSRSWRNNNPGNLEYGPFARAHGAIGTDGRFAIFPSEKVGTDAQRALLFKSDAYRNLTLPQAVSRWAPRADRNDVGAYVRAMGGDRSGRRMGEYSPAEQDQMLTAMRRHEGWAPGSREHEGQKQLFGAPAKVPEGQISAIGGGPVKAFIVHHTGGGHTVEDIQRTFRARHVGAEYIMDREGNIHVTGGPGAHHILRGWGKGAGLSSGNTVGMEIIAKDDRDVTALQKQRAVEFIQKNYPTTPVYGHGEVNPGHKEATEGLTVTEAVRAERAARSAAKE